MRYRISRHPLILKSIYAATFIGCVLLAMTAINAEAGSETAAETNYSSLWSDGSQKEQGSIVDDLRVGVWTSWYPNGQKSELGQYHEGHRIGIWTFWDEDGSFNRIERFATPSLIDEIGLDEDFLEIDGDTPEWKAHALAAGYLLLYIRATQERDIMLYQRALRRIDKSIAMEEHYENTRLKVLILQKIDFRDFQEAASRAIELGKKERPNYTASKDYKAFSEIVAQDGC